MFVSVTVDNHSVKYYFFHQIILYCSHPKLARSSETNCSHGMNVFCFKYDFEGIKILLENNIWPFTLQPPHALQSNAS